MNQMPIASDLSYEVLLRRAAKGELRTPAIHPLLADHFGRYEPAKKIVIESELNSRVDEIDSLRRG